jgi:photosystem II stability/assembly factor-like uncharacterized protein
MPRHRRFPAAILLAMALGCTGQHRPPVADPAQTFDAPDSAFDFGRHKRLPADPGFDSVVAYRTAEREVLQLPVYSTGLDAEVAARAAELRPDKAVLGRWQSLGPGNIGGRTRALSVDPKEPRFMVAAGVSGGIWRTTNAGESWVAVGDQLANIAVSCLARDPNVRNHLWAGTGEGHFREIVRGTSLPLRGGGVYRSYDGGKTWSFLNATKGGNFHWVNDVVVSPGDSRRAYVATRTGVFRTTNDGKKWTRLLDPEVQGGCFDLELVRQGNAEVMFASCGTFAQATVYRSANAAGSAPFVPVLTEEGMGRTSLAVAPSAPNTVYALSASIAPGPYDGGLHAVFRSDQGGVAGSWRATVRNTDPDKLSTLLLSNPAVANQVLCGFGSQDFSSTLGWYTNTIAVDPTNPEVVFAGGVDLFRSDDGGETWGPITYWWASPPSAHADQHVIAFHPKWNGGSNQRLFLGGDGGVWRTDNALAPRSSSATSVCNPANSSVTWTSLNHGYGVTQFYHGTPMPGGGSYFGGTQDNGTIFGVDGGPNGWQRIHGGDGGYVAVDPHRPERMWAESQGLALVRSVDGGRTFTSAISGITEPGSNFLFITPFTLDQQRPDRLWIGGRSLWRSDDGALSWRGASAPLSTSAKVSAIAVSPVDSDRVAVGTSAGAIHVTSAAGSATSATSWPGVVPREGFVSSIAFHPTDPFRLWATYATFGGPHVWESRDGGLSWSPIDGSGPRRLPDLPVHSVVADPDRPERLFLGTDLGVFVSTTGGQQWSIENTGFANVVTESLAVATGEGGTRWLFAFTHGRGAWRVKL